MLIRPEPQLHTYLTIIALIYAVIPNGCSVAFGVDRIDDSKPNVLMIVMDDLNDWVGCLKGNPQVQTPNIDRLASRGTLFTNAHAPAPVCNPSRVAVLTGRNPSSTGIYDNSVVWHQALSETQSIPLHFLNHGYKVAGGGKVHHHMPGFNRKSDWHEYFDQRFDGHYQDQVARGQTRQPFNWPDRFPLNGLENVRMLKKPPKNPHEFDWGIWTQDENTMADNLMIDWAIECIRTARNSSRSQPFFLATGIYRPHLPMYAPKKYFDLYPIESIQMPPILEDDLEDLPKAGLSMAKDRGGDYQLVMEKGKLPELIQAYLASISYADALVGKLIEAIDQCGLAENTVIILWSDHGWHLGEKNHLHKFTLWERSTRVPLIVATPKIGRPGQVSHQPVSLVDLFPTLCDICSLPTPKGIDGQSFSPLLKNPDRESPRPAITTHGYQNHAVRSDRFRYIRYADGGEELYDHSKDPHEWHNLAEDPTLQTIKDSLRKWLPQSDAKPLKTRPGSQGSGD